MENCKSPIIIKSEKSESQDDGICATQFQDKDLASMSTNDDMLRVIKGIKVIPDEEFKEFLDEEDFMDGLDVVDAWEGDEEKNRDAEQDGTRPVKREEKPSPR